MTEDAVYRRRHEFKDRIDAEARRMRREVHPAYLAMVSLDGGDICVGIRDRIEMAHVVGDPMVDLSIWIDRRGIPDDPKLDFDAELCDIIIPNYWGLREFHSRLARLAASLCILKGMRENGKQD